MIKYQEPFLLQVSYDWLQGFCFPVPAFKMYYLIGKTGIIFRNSTKLSKLMIIIYGLTATATETAVWKAGVPGIPVRIILCVLPNMG